jgi:hypothetical protein
MNKKLIKGSLAGVALVAIAAGGTTYSAWSDFGVSSNAAGAGIMKLTVSDRDGSTAGVAPFSLAPGQNKAQEFFLASADADNVPVGALTAKIQNLKDIEDNGPACTTNSEAIAEDPSAVDAHGLPTNPLNSCGGTGELSTQATVQILVSDPVANASSCPNTGIYHAATVTPALPAGSTLASAATRTFQLGNVSAGQGVCVRMEMSLPASATNSVQGDDVTYDWRFDLAQVV